MKILHIVTYISPDGAYGGPLRVALNQSKALSKLGHEVVIAAAAGGFEGALPRKFNKSDVQMFQGSQILPKNGYAGLISPRMIKWLLKESDNFDVIHVHLARDLVTLPAAATALFKKKPLVVQTHGMIDPSHRKLARPLDWLLTRPVLRKAATVLYLTDREQADLTNVAGKSLSFVPLSNGVPVPTERAIEQVDGPRTKPEVLYLARLHAIKRPLVVVAAAKSLSEKYPNATFSLIGPDEGEGTAVRSGIEQVRLGERLRWLGPIAPDRTANRMKQASIYVLPSQAESFGMSIAEAMSIGLPVIVTENCELASVIKKHNAGLVCNLSQDDFNASLDRLLGDSELRMQMGANGRNAIIESFSMKHVANELTEAYLAVIDKGKNRND